MSKSHKSRSADCWPNNTAVEKIPIASKCNKCGNFCENLWPLGGGVCDKCLVKNFSLLEAFAGTCSCLHKKVVELYEKNK